MNEMRSCSPSVIVTWTAGHLVTTRVFGRDSKAGVVGGVSSAFSNLVLLGIPFMLGVFGQKGFEELSLLISVHLPTMLMASIILFELIAGDLVYTDTPAGVGPVVSGDRMEGGVAELPTLVTTIA